MIVFLLLTILAGALLPIQTGVNLQLRGLIGHPLTAALVSFIVGAIGLAVASVVARAPLTLGGAWSRSEWWHWAGGLLGAVYIVGTIVLAPRLGAATFVAALVAGQMFMSLVIDHYGWVGFAEHAVSPLRVLGALLVVGGVLLVQR
jgi:bacterial/archaeal transporter family-2 protein